MADPFADLGFVEDAPPSGAPDPFADLGFVEDAPVAAPTVKSKIGERRRISAESVERRLKLPTGLLVASIEEGMPAISNSARDAILRDHKIDARLSDVNTIEAQGLLLQKALKDNNGDQRRAIIVTHAGPDPAGWGKQTVDYASRVLLRQEERNPPPVPSAPIDEPGIIDRIGEAITGNERATESTETLPEWTAMPEVSILATAMNAAQGGSAEGLAGNLASAAKGSLGTLFGGSEDEIEQIIKANSPNTTTRRDEKGNLIFRSGTDQQEYAYKPGITSSDVARGTMAIGAFGATGGGAGASILRQVAGAGVTQAAIEGSQAATGGEFGTGETVAAAMMAGAVPVVGSLLRRSAPATVALAPVITRTSAGSGADAASAVRSQAMPSIADAQMSTLIKDAAKGDAAARETLAGRLALSPNESGFLPFAQVQQAAEDIGVTLPADVMSGSKQMKAIVGGVRSKIGGQAQAEFMQTLDDVTTKADEIMKNIGAHYGPGGRPAPSVTAQRVKDALDASQAELDAIEEQLHQTVRAAVPLTTPMRLNATRSLIRDILKENVGKPLSPAEKKLQTLASNPDATYGAMHETMQEIGAATRGVESPYGGVVEGKLKRLYSALATDRDDNVLRVAPGMVDTLKKANATTVAKKKLEEKMIGAFGKEGTRALDALMSRAAGGDKEAFTKLMAVTPAPMRKEVIATALADVVHDNGKFSLVRFNKLFGDLRENAPVYSQMTKELGPGANELLTATYGVTRAVQRASAGVKHTGIANEMLESLEGPSGFMERVLATKIGKGAAIGAAGIVGSAVGGTPGAGIGAAAGGAIVNALAHSPEANLKAAAKLFNDPTFHALAVAIAKKGKVDPNVIRKVTFSDAWRSFAAQAGMPRDPKASEQFLSAALQSARSSTTEEK